MTALNYIHSLQQSNVSSLLSHVLGPFFYPRPPLAPTGIVVIPSRCLSVCPLVRPERHYRSLSISPIDLTVGGMVHSIIEQLAIINGYARPIFAYSTELWNFCRLWPGLRDDVTALIFKDFGYWPELWWVDVQFHEADRYTKLHVWPILARFTEFWKLHDSLGPSPRYNLLGVLDAIGTCQHAIWRNKLLKLRVSCNKLLFDSQQFLQTFITAMGKTLHTVFQYFHSWWGHVSMWT